MGKREEYHQWKCQDRVIIPVEYKSLSFDHGLGFSVGSVSKLFFAALRVPRTVLVPTIIDKGSVIAAAGAPIQLFRE